MISWGLSGIEKSIDQKVVGCPSRRIKVGDIEAGGGEFYTPKGVVNLIAEMIEPYKGKIYAPCWSPSAPPTSWPR